MSKKRDCFTKYGQQARNVLDALLEKYADHGIEHIEDMRILSIEPLSSFGTPVEIAGTFGGPELFLQAMHELEEELYKPTAS